tara:strand:+ start:395 stop:970 length:576 start_codon:yes stop_codon:yes gene_type:complete
MIKIGITGGIGSGKTFVAKQFASPIFNADREVKKIYLNDRNCYKKLKKVLPKYISSFPISKKYLGQAILKNKSNLKKINNIVHPIIRKKLKKFLKKNKKKKIIVLDIPLLLENKINKKNYIIIFVEAKKKDIISNLKKRKNFNKKIFKILNKFQLSLEFKKKRSDFVIKNNFNPSQIRKSVKMIKKKILYK